MQIDLISFITDPKSLRESDFELQYHAQAKSGNRKLGGRAVFSDGGGGEDDDAVN
ncbi:hypothetical protein CGMCC3_g13965 [Colletotrichum fructicola]|nr:uncharacterized protein CGMCC3_g13965 [Colletotrichum fructicola]KAE9569912.1 hypothetical protein CGMCC3_g13965 [Colletotrichum fructicola]